MSLVEWWNKFYLLYYIYIYRTQTQSGQNTKHQSLEYGTNSNKLYMWKWIQYLCIHIYVSLTNTVDLLLPFTICCNFFRSSSHWIISFVIYIRLGPYHVGTLKLPTYICACTMYHVHEYISLTHSFTHTLSLSWFRSFALALTLFWILFFFHILHAYKQFLSKN